MDCKTEAYEIDLNVRDKKIETLKSALLNAEKALRWNVHNLQHSEECGVINNRKPGEDCFACMAQLAIAEIRRVMKKEA